MVVKLGAVIYMTPVFVIPGLGIGALGARLGNIYIKAQLSVKREMSNARSPVFSHFNAAIAGLRASLLSYHPDSLFIEIKASIRAYGAQEAFKQSSLTRIDKYTRLVRNMIARLKSELSLFSDARGHSTISTGTYISFVGLDRS
jgi:hypothetical protein